MRAAVVRTAAAALATTALIAGGVVAAEPAWASVLTVEVTADGDDNGACDDPAVTTPASPVTLRNAICVANNDGGAMTVVVPAGTYTLTGGALVVGTQPGSRITLDGEGGPVIAGDGSSQLLTLDPDLVGDVDVTISGFTFSGGRDALYGGGAIIAGSGPGVVQTDELRVEDSVFDDNRSSAGTASPGGAIQFVGGRLTIVDSTFTDNSAGSAEGGAVYYEAVAGGADQGLQITGSSFGSNTVQASGGLANGGGAVAFDTNGVFADASGISITGSSFSGNVAATADGSPTEGGAIRQDQGPATITGNAFTGNAAQGAAAGGGAVDSGDGALALQYNRFTGNTGAGAVRADASSAVDATRSWWGCATGPGAAPCDAGSGATVTTAPYLTLTASVADAVIDAGDTTTLTASLLVDSAGAGVDPARLGAFAGATVTWSSVQPTGSSVSPTSPALANGVATTTFTAGAAGGVGGAAVALDQASVAVPIAVRAPAAFTSATTAQAVVGAAASIAVTTSGYPVPTVALDSGTLPAGLAFTSNPDGTATISGTPAAGTEGDYPLELSADNGGTPATRTLTVTVGSVPVFTGSSTLEVAAGAAVDAAITAVGSPIPTISAEAPLPTGLVLADQGDGSARLSGTPTVPAGVYPLLFRASNTHGSALKPITLTITEPPSFTSAGATQFTAGTPGTFSIAVAQGVPADAGAVTIVGDAPAWLSVTGAPGSQQLAGTPPAGSGGSYAFALSVANGAGTATQPFTLTVVEAPGYTGPTTLGAQLGVGFDRTLSFGGYPAPALALIGGTLPTGVTFVDLGGGQARISGTPVLGSEGAYPVVIEASNGAGALPQTITIEVGLAPVITSADRTAFAVGAAGAFPVTVAPGYPAPGPVAFGGTVPAWLALAGPVGAQELVGTPPAGAGGAVGFDLVVSNASGSTTQHFTLTVYEAPVVTGQPAAQSAIAGDEVAFTATASGYPMPGVQWQRFDGTSWADVPGATSTTLSFTAALADDGTDYRAVFTGAGVATSDPAVLAVGTVPDFGGIPAVRLLPGAPRSFDVTVAGSPAAAISVVGALPAWLSFIDHGDGTGTFSGTPTLDDVAFTVIELEAVNAYGSAQGWLSLEVTAAVVPPETPPLPDGPLGGVPAQLVPGQRITVSGAGFLAGAPIVLGMYSQPTTLGTATADAAGAFSATVTVPAGQPLGAHTLVATGVGAAGEARLLAASTTLVAPSTGGGANGTGTPSGLGATGFDPLLPMLLAAAVVLAGLVLLVSMMLRRRRRG
ncbi:putative Ig domain-containing protein [Agromyces soli]